MMSPSFGHVNWSVLRSQMVQDHCWKDAFFTHFNPFLVAEWPVFGPVMTQSEPKQAQKWAQTNCFGMFWDTL